MQSRLTNLKKLLLNFNLNKEAQIISDLEDDKDPADIDWEAELGQKPLTDEIETDQQQEQKHYGDWLSAIPEMFDNLSLDKLSPRGEGYFYYIGNGSFRTVYGIKGNDNFVIKVERGYGDQNKQEFITQKIADGLFPRVYTHGDFKGNLPSFRWMVVERVKPLDADKFSSFFPSLIKFTAYINTIEGAKKHNRIIYDDLYSLPYQMNPSAVIQKAFAYLPGKANYYEWVKAAFETAYKEEPLFAKIYDLGLKLGVHMSDVKPVNCGITSDGRFVLLDMGFHSKHGDSPASNY